MSERKPKERKPLIQPGSVLGEGPDIFSSVLSSYAESTGQPAPVVRQEQPQQPEPEPEEPSAAAAQAEAPARASEEQAPPEEVVPEAPRPVRPSGQPARQPADKPAKQTRPPKAKQNASAEEEARARAATPKRLCSYRIPEALDDWLEEQAFANRHAGLKKQDLVAEALQLLIVARSAPHEEDQD